MIDGKIEVVRAHRRKLAGVLHQCVVDLIDVPDDQLNGALRTMNHKLIDWLQEENRLLAHHAGEKVEPKAIPIEAVVRGRGGGIF